MRLVKVIYHSLENYEPDAKLTFQPLWQAAYGQEQEQQPVVSNELSKEVAAIKAQLLVLVSKLDRIEQEMAEH